MMVMTMMMTMMIRGSEGAGRGGSGRLIPSAQGGTAGLLGVSQGRPGACGGARGGLSAVLFITHDAPRAFPEFVAALLATTRARLKVSCHQVAQAPLASAHTIAAQQCKVWQAAKGAYAKASSKLEVAKKAMACAKFGNGKAVKTKGAAFLAALEKANQARQGLINAKADTRRFYPHPQKIPPLAKNTFGTPEFWEVTRLGGGGGDPLRCG